MREKLFTFLKIGISVVLILVVFSRVPLALVARQLAAAQIGLVVLALIMYVVAVTINAAKWQVLLHAQKVRIPFAPLLQFQFIGLFFNNFLPAQVGGDVMRGYGLARYTDRTADAAVSVIVDRIVGFVAYMATAVLAAFVAVAVAGHSELRGIEWVAIVTFCGLCALLGLLLSRRLRGLISRLCTWRPLARLAPIWESLSQAFDSYHGRYRALAAAFGIGLLGILCTTLVNWFLSLSLGGGMSLLQIVLFNPLIALVLTIPISIGGVGVNQSAYVFFYGLAGVPMGHALAVSVLMQLVMIVASLPGGVLWLRIRRRTQAAGPEPLKDQRQEEFA